MNAYFLTWLIQNMQEHKNWTYKNSNNSHLQENSIKKFHESHIMQRLNYILTDMLNTSHCIFMILKRNMTWCWNINNWESIIHELIEFMKLWNSTYNIVKTTVYMNYHDTFMIIITRTWSDMSCLYLAAWYYFRITMNLLQAHETWYYLRITNMSYLKYVRYKLNYSICLHENEIMRSSQLSWKTLKKFLNWNHMLTHNHLYQKNIMIWLMFLKDRTLISCFYIEKNMTLKLIWN